MEICMVSGKGGTGKTSISVGLAVALAGCESEPVRLLDCDVEAPNAHLYFRGGDAIERDVTVTFPTWDSAACDRCGECVTACEFGAMGLFGDRLEVFREHCHSCGTCIYVCSKHALVDSDRRIGAVHQRETDGLQLAWGSLDIGEPRGVPLIEHLRGDARSSPGITVVDGPPGTSCPMVAAVVGADVAIIVTESTVFGLHDLQLVRKTLDLMHVPYGVVINKCQGAWSATHDYCQEEAIPILLEVPLARDIAAGGAEGIPLPVIRPKYRAVLEDLPRRCGALLGRRAVA